MYHDAAPAIPGRQLAFQKKLESWLAACLEYGLEEKLGNINLIKQALYLLNADCSMKQSMPILSVIIIAIIYPIV